MSKEHLLSENQALSKDKAFFSPAPEEISKRAHQIYLNKGCETGRELDHWLQAEAELAELPLRELAKIPIRDLRKRNKNKSVVDVVRNLVTHQKSTSCCKRKNGFHEPHSEDGLSPHHTMCNDCMKSSQG